MGIYLSSLYWYIFLIQHQTILLSEYLNSLISYSESDDQNDTEFDEVSESDSDTGDEEYRSCRQKISNVRVDPHQAFLAEMESLENLATNLKV